MGVVSVQSMGYHQSIPDSERVLFLYLFQPVFKCFSKILQVTIPVLYAQE